MDLGEQASGPEAQKSRKSLEKVSQGRVPKVRKKSRKWSEKSKKNLKMGFWRLFRTLSRLFSDFWDPDFFETFWLRAPRLPVPGPRNLKSRSQKVIRRPVRGFPYTLLFCPPTFLSVENSCVFVLCGWLKLTKLD